MRLPGLLVATCVALALAGCGGSSKPSPGPFAVPGNAVGAVDAIAVFDVQPGWIVPNDQLVLGPIRSPAVLLDVRLQHPRDARGVTIRYAATQLHGQGTQSGGIGWHPARWHARPVHGFVVKPHTTAAIWVGVSATKLGRYDLRGFVVDYRIGDSLYSAPQGLGLRFCAFAHVDFRHMPRCGD